MHQLHQVRKIEYPDVIKHNAACMASLKYILLLQRDVPKAASFYSEGLGLSVRVLSERWAELEAGGSTIALKAVEGYATSPFAYFGVVRE